MSIGALIKGVEKRLRSEEVFDDRPDQLTGAFVGRQPAPGRPPAQFGQFWCSVYWGGGRGNDMNPQRHDVFNAVTVTLTARLNYAPRDKHGVRFGEVGDVYELVDRIIGPNIIHGNWATINFANEFIPGTQQWVDIHGGTATVNGYVETLVLQGFGPEREAPGDWVGGTNGSKDVYVIDMKFAMARRIQVNY